MLVLLPTPRALVALLALMPGVWLAGRSLARAVTREHLVRIVLAPILALAAWLLTVHVLALATHSFVPALCAGTALVAVAGVAVHVRFHARMPPSIGRSISPWMWVTMVASTAVIAPMALNFAFHDEIYFAGHMSILGEIQNGIYPPRHLTFVDLPLRYHYGFDLLCACIGVLFRLPADHAIEAVTLPLWALSWCLLWTLGDRLLGRRAAWLVPLCVMFGGGAPVNCRPADASWVSNVLDGCMIGDKALNPPLVSYFFQHPWTLGLPLALGAILVFGERRAVLPAARYAALGLLIAAVSFGEIVLFVCLLPSFVAVAFIHEGRFAWRLGARMVALAVLVVGIAKSLGGFFATAPGLPKLAFSLARGIGATPHDTLLWNAKTFGLVALVGVLGLAFLRRDRLLFALLAGGGFAVVNFVTYGSSWDIAKFATVAAIALGVLASATIARLLVPADRSPRAGTALVGAALLAGLIAHGTLFPLLLMINVPGLPRWFVRSPDAITDDDAAAASWLRRHIGPGELVYRNHAVARAYAQWAGLPQVWTEYTTDKMGLSKTRIASRDKLLTDLPPDASAYTREGIRWFVLDAADAKLGEVTDTWIKSGRAHAVFAVKSIRIVRLDPPKSP